MRTPWLVPFAVVLTCAATTGVVVSRTVTVNVPVPPLFAASFAVITTTVVPMGNSVPLSCEYVSPVTPTASLALPAA